MLNLTVRTFLLASREERDAWEHAARMDGRTLSSWIRFHLNVAAEASSIPPPPSQDDDDAGPVLQ